MQTERLYLPNSSCTFLHCDNAHKAQTQAQLCSLTRAVGQQCLEPLPALLCLTTVTCLELGLLFTPGSQHRATAEPTLRLLGTPTSSSVSRTCGSQPQTVSKATEVSMGKGLLSFTTISNNNLLLQAERLELKGFKTSRQRTFLSLCR